MPNFPCVPRTASNSSAFRSREQVTSSPSHGHPQPVRHHHRGEAVLERGGQHRPPLDAALHVTPAVAEAQHPVHGLHVQHQAARHHHLATRRVGAPARGQRHAVLPAEAHRGHHVQRVRRPQHRRWPPAAHLPEIERRQLHRAPPEVQLSPEGREAGDPAGRRPGRRVPGLLLSVRAQGGRRRLLAPGRLARGVFQRGGTGHGGSSSG